MLRRVPTICRWVLTVVTVLLLAVWLASGRWEVGWTFKDGRKGITPGADQGRFFLFRGTGFGPREGFWIRDRTDPAHAANGPYRMQWLPAVESGSWPSIGASHHIIYVPLYMPAALTGSLAYLAWRWPRRRDRGGVCKKCGYDLRGLNGDGCGKPICPECGA